MDILRELDWRGLYADCTDRDGLARRLGEGPITLYCGFDPTSDSLHVGNLVPLFALRRFQLAGHRPIALAGGATGMIGDPSGKSEERTLLTPDQLAHHLDCIRPQLARFLDFSAPSNPARVVNNYDWTAGVPVLEFLRDIGKHLTINTMMAKESVRARMEGEGGISFTEFSYMLLQGFDFYHLRKAYDCELQVGASDQWGNITVGIELTRKKLGAGVWGLVFPLLTKADGTKYGKTSTGTVWLDPVKTSPYRFYQYFLNIEDANVVALLKTLTFLPEDAITALTDDVAARPEARSAQRALAAEMTRLVHGADALDAAAKASEILFEGVLADITDAAMHHVVAEAPTTAVPRQSLEGSGTPVVDLIVRSGLATSKGEARRALESGGVYLNNVRIDQPQRAVTMSDALLGKYILLRKGKRNYAVITAD